MVRSKILLVGLVLTPAVLVVTGHSSLGEAKGDECRAKPDSSAPAGMHWYYRVDRTNSRHCWYLHEQGMRVHSLIESAPRHPATRNDVADEQIREIPPVTGTPWPPSAITVEPANLNFAGRWIDLPKSVDLNAHEPVGASNGYAAEQRMENRQGPLPPALAGVSAVSGDVRQNAGPQTNFGSLSLAGAVVLALLLVSEALIRFIRASGWSLLRRHERSQPGYYSEAQAAPLDAAPDPGWSNGTASEPLVHEHTGGPTGVRELRRLLQGAGTGLGPPRSFAPSRSAQRREHASHARAHSTFERLKSRSFSGMTWAPL
jgi:hypothetical protein